MKLLNKSSYVFPVALFFLLLGLFFEFNPQVVDNPERAAARFQKVLSKKEDRLKLLMNDLIPRLGSAEHPGEVLEDEVLNKKLDRMGFSLLLFEKDTLTAWTDKGISIEEVFSLSKLSNKLVFLGNGWYRTMHIMSPQDIQITGLILLRHQYIYQNQFLKNTFHRSFRLPECVELVQSPMDGAFPIYDSEEEFLCNLDFNTGPDCRTSGIPFSAISYLLGFLLFLISAQKLLRYLRKWIPINWSLLILGGLFWGINWFFFNFRIPAPIFELELFSPYYFALSRGCSSLGHLLVSSILIFYFSFLFYRDFDYSRWVNKQNRNVFFFANLLAFTLGAAFFAYDSYIFKSLISSSDIVFEPYRILELNFFSMAGYLAVVLLFFSTGLYFFKIINAGKENQFKFHYLMAWLLSMVVFIFQFLFQNPRFDLASLAFFIILVVMIYRMAPRLSFVALILFSIVFSLYSTWIIVSISEKKELYEREVMALNLSARNDPVAELLLENLVRKIQEDKSLEKLMNRNEFMDEDVEELSRHLMNTYFNGYWEKYEFVFYPCSPESEVYDEDSYLGNCIDFFTTLLDSTGEALEAPGFYNLEDEGDQISYAGLFSFTRDLDSLNNILYIEFFSRPFFRQMGYPELLLDEEISGPGFEYDYSFAKYNNGNLTQQSGDYKYSLSDREFTRQDLEISEVSIGGYKHLVYQEESGRTIVVSQEKLNVINLLISFSYLFVFLFMLSAVIYRISSPRLLFREKASLLKNKIQLWMTLILFVSLVFIGAGAVYFSFSQYRAKQDDNLREKIQSVYVELDHKLGFIEKLSGDWSQDQYANLDELLIKFSNVFFTDIHLFDPSGSLLATSRPEIFDRGLTGYKMDYKAYRELHHRLQAEYVSEESIGNFTFLSAYVPFNNANNQLLAYLNLPYFIRQSTLTEEITNLVVGIVNFSMVMVLLVLLFSVIISNQITKPLKLIKEKMGAIKLGRQSEPILYEQEDEIGGLVLEYNRMIDELANSAEALARSERESAWREMARQIAHEIKNPLTPMKLSIQHLKRAWEDKSPDWEEQLKKISETLVEQIDNLSSIASAFSSFAEMPGTRNQKMDLVAIIHNRVSLFANNEKISFSLDLEDTQHAWIFADENQFLRVFNNLIQNAIQSIPEDREGLISIKLRTGKKYHAINLSDNGSGIPEALGDKLFEPNFTTKSSGMGLGLAIVKKIIDDAGGSINYETKFGAGTTFILKIPIFSGEE